MISPKDAKFVSKDQIDLEEYIRMGLDINSTLSRIVWDEHIDHQFFLTLMYKKSTVDKIMADLREVGWEIDDRTDSAYRGFYVKNPFRKSMPKVKNNPWWVRWFRAIT